MKLLQPKDVMLKSQNGEELHYRIGKYPALAGREIISQYPIANIMNGKDYQASEAVMLKLMAHIARISTNDKGEEVEIFLANKAVVDSHVPDWEVLGKLELLSIEYNCSFFANGKASIFLKGLGQKALPKITEMLIPLLDKLSPVVKQHWKN